MSMQKRFSKLITSIHFFAAMVLIIMSLLIMAWAVYEVFASIPMKGEFIPRMLQSVGAIVISAAIIDVAQYMIEEDVFTSKQLRDPKEARRTLTKIIVIITIAVSIEGLVYIFKAGTENMALLVYPAWLLFVSAILIVSLGIYQKLSAAIEKEEATKEEIS